MKKFFKKRLNRQLFEVSVSLVVILSFFGTSFLAQVAEAKPVFLAGLSNLFSNNNEKTEIIEDSVSSFPDMEEAEPRMVVLAVMTAYSSDVAQTDSTPCIPADFHYNLCEHYEQEGEQNTIATNFLPLGTKVRFPELYGDKVFVVRDRMNARYGYGRGDIWMPSRAEAVAFGVKRVKMEVFYR